MTYGTQANRLLVAACLPDDAEGPAVAKGTMERRLGAQRSPKAQQNSNRLFRPRTMKGLVGACLAGMLVAGPGSHGGAVAATTAKSAKPAPAAAAPRIATPKTLHALLVERLRNGTIPDGARARLQELQVRELPLASVPGVVLERNLDILSAIEGLGIARTLVTQSDAFFDPTLFSSLSYTNRFTSRRVDVIGRFREVDPSTRLAEEQRIRDAQAQGIDVADPEAAGSCTPNVNVDGELIASSPCTFPPVYSVDSEYASFESRSDHRSTGSLGAGIQLPFGGSATLSLSSTWHKPAASSSSGTPPLTSAAYPNGGDPYDPFGFNDRKMFWTSSAGVSLSMPLPYTKGFGNDGNPGNFSLRMAQSGERRAGWSTKSARNNNLAQALLGYWDLVGSGRTLQTVLELRGTLTERLASQKRLFDSGLATRYDLAQVESELASLDSREEAAWNSLLTQSNRLLTLVATDQRVLLVPRDFEDAIRRPLAVGGPASGEDHYQLALTTHPDIKAQEEDHDASRVTLAFRDNQNQPDLSLSASFGVSQSDAVFGYESLPQSLARLAKPDTTNFFIGVRYRLPLGMNQTEAALERARLEEKQAYDRTRLVRQQVVNAVDQSLGDMNSAEALVQQSEADLKLAEFAFDRAREQRDLGLVAEFEVLSKYTDLVNARLGLVSAQVELRKAHIRLLAARGTLEQDYVR